MVTESQADRIYVYTDASFSHQHKVGVIGFSIFSNSEKHESVLLKDNEIKLLEIREKNNICAEFRSALVALDSIKNAESPKSVVLFSDCQTLIGLPQRRQSLEENLFISKSKNALLANAKLYQDFFILYDKFDLECIWVKGHFRAGTLDRVHENFSYLDKAVRKQLRISVDKLEGSQIL